MKYIIVAIFTLGASYSFLLPETGYNNNNEKQLELRDSINFSISYKMQVGVGKDDMGASYTMSSFVKDENVEIEQLETDVFSSFIITIRSTRFSLIKVNFHSNDSLLILFDQSEFENRQGNIKFLEFGFSKDKVPVNKFLLVRTGAKIKNGKCGAYIRKVKYLPLKKLNDYYW